MTAPRDLVEAAAYERRRLAAALLGGAPGGREPAAPRGSRALAGGVGLALLLVVGVVVGTAAGLLP